MSARPPSRPAPILAFCHLRKTGGVTFNQVLRRSHGGAHLDAIVRYLPGTRRNQQFYTLADLEHDRLIYPRLKSIAGHYLCPAVDYGALGERFRWVTLLRDPCRRYVSHYAQHVEKMGVVEDFESWMLHEKHCDDQVKTLAGSADLDRAKDLLETRFIVGLIERYERSMQVFQESLTDFTLDVRQVPRANPAKGQIDARALAQKFDAQIRRNNELDQALYDFACEVLWPRQLKALTRKTVGPGSVTRRRPAPPGWSRLAWARVKRNLLYKPFVRLTR